MPKRKQGAQLNFHAAEYMYVLETAMDPDVEPSIKIMLAQSMIERVNKNPPEWHIQRKMLRALNAIIKENERR